MARIVNGHWNYNVTYNYLLLAGNVVIVAVGVVYRTQHTNFQEDKINTLILFARNADQCIGDVVLLDIMGDNTNTDQPHI